MKLIAKEVHPQKMQSSVSPEVIVDDLGFDFSVIHKKVRRDAGWKNQLCVQTYAHRPPIRNINIDL